MKAGAARRAWALSGLTLTIVATTSVLCFVNRDSIHDLNQLPLIEIVLPVGFALVGGLVASSDLDHPRLQDRGQHELKGLPGTWRLYALQ